MRTSNPSRGNRREAHEDAGLGSREFYTVSQLAELLQLTEMTVYRMISRGDLPCYAIGRVKRFRQCDIEKFLENCRTPPSAGGRRLSLRQSALGNEVADHLDA